MGFVNDRSRRNDRKTIDRERNIILRDIPFGYPDPEQPYELEWHGQIIKFRCETITLARHKTHDNWKFDLRKEVCMLEIPEGFPETRAKIIVTIDEALTVYGADQFEQRTGKVDVQFSSHALGKCY